MAGSWTFWGQCPGCRILTLRVQMPSVVNKINLHDSAHSKAMYRPPLNSIIVAIAVTFMLAFLLVFHPTFELHLNTEASLTESYDYQQTTDKAQCFNSIEPLSKMKTTNPKVVHILWGFGKAELTFMNYLAIRSALISLKPDTLKLHYEDLNHNNKWFQKLQDHITLVQHNLATEYPKQLQEHWQVSHIADVLRLDILNREGGIYLDADVISLRLFDTLLHSARDVVLGHEGGDRHSLCNAIVLARANAVFINQWIGRYSDFSPSEWNYHSVLMPKETALAQPHEICTLAPTVFFWPTWKPGHIKYMHESLSEEEALEVENLLDAYGGALYLD